MCSKLCDEDSFVSSQCDGNRWGKNVQILTCVGCATPGRDTTVVMKALFDMDIWDYGVRVSFSPEMTLEEKVEVALTEIRNHSTRYFDTEFADHPDLISYFLGMDYRQAIKELDTSNAADVVLRTTISLAVQWEYLSMKVLGDQRFLPKIYGTCGQAYFVEYTPSLGKYNHVLFQGKAPDILNPKQYMPSWHERVNVALKLLKLIVLIEDTYSRPLHMCDIQIHNYGVSGNEVVLMDSDSVRFETINLDKNCSLEGCRYLTCIGVCGKNNTCAEEMVSNNLQVSIMNHALAKGDLMHVLYAEPHGSVGSVQDLGTGGRWFDPRLGQYSFRGLMIVIATGFIPLPPLSVVSAMVK